jgi:hypothetical protein
VEQWWNVTDREKELFSEKNLSQCHSVHHKLDKGRLESNLGLRSEMNASNRLRHGVTSEYTLPIPLAGRSKTWICGRSLAGITGSNAGGAWMSVS